MHSVSFYSILSQKKVQNNNFEKNMYKEKSPNWILKTFTYKEIKIDIDTLPADMFGGTKFWL